MKDFRLKVQQKYGKVDYVATNDDCQLLLIEVVMAAITLKSATMEYYNNYKVAFDFYQTVLAETKELSKLFGQLPAKISEQFLLLHNLEIIIKNSYNLMKEEAERQTLSDYFTYKSEQNDNDDFCSFVQSEAKQLIKLLNLIKSDVSNEKNVIRKCEPLMIFEAFVSRQIEMNIRNHNFAINVLKKMRNLGIMIKKYQTNQNYVFGISEN